MPTLTGTPFQHTAARRRLIVQRIKDAVDSGFNTQPPEGGWPLKVIKRYLKSVSTHSRPKAAGPIMGKLSIHQKVSTHSRPKAAGVHIDA